MYLKTKIELNYNDGLTGQTSSIIYGRIENIQRNGDCTNFLGAYAYTRIDTIEEETVETLISSGVFMLENEEQIESLYNLIKDGLPTTEDEPLYERTKNYLAFRYEMLNTFLPLNPDLTINDIEIFE
jgi:hypothetical protein